MTTGDVTRPNANPGGSTPPPAGSPGAPPIEHVRIGHSVSPYSPTLTQITLRKLLETQKPVDFKKETIPRITETTASALSKIDALFDAIYGSEILTEKDGVDIDQLSAVLEIEQRKIEGSKDLSRSEKKEELKHLRIAKTALKELRELATALDRIQPLDEELQQSFDTVSDYVFTPEFEGDAVLGASSIKAGLDVLKSLHEQSFMGIEGTAPRNVSQHKYGEAKTAFSSAFDEWSETTLKGIRIQKKTLLNEYRNSQGTARDEIGKLLSSLLREERAAIRTLLQGAADLKGTKDLHDINKLLVKAAEQLNEEARSLAAMLKKESIPLDKAVSYGSPVWKVLAEKHLPKPELEQQKEWSPLAKRLMFGLFQGVQVYNQVSQMNQRVWEAMDASSAEKTQPEWTAKVQGKVTTIGTAAAMHHVPPAEQNAAAAAQVLQGAARLENSLAQVNQTIVEIRSNDDKSLKPLIKEAALLKRELLKTAERTPKDTCTLVELAHWMQEVDDKCYAIERIEHRIGVLMAEARATLSPNDQELEKFGKKHANNIRLQRVVEGLQLDGVKVPDSKGIKSDQVSEFLKAQAPEVFDAWQALGTLYKTRKEDPRFIESSEATQHLDAIVKGIERAFAKAAASQELFEQLVTPDVIDWLDRIATAKDYLMVRSTGAEDSRKTANAGGNLSRNYVKPTREEFCKAAGEVIASYFGYNSLQNRINAGDNPFEEELKLAVTAQELIGEAVGGETTVPSQIPISLVLFTSEPMFVGEEKFRAMRLSATYGHGEGVVGAQGISSDTALLLISEAHPDRLYVMYENREKPHRLAPVSIGGTPSLASVPNPEAMRNRPVLDAALLSRLYSLGVITEHFFGDNATDMEIVIKGDTIYPVQARPVNRQPANPSYIDRKKLAAVEPSPVIDTFRSEVIVPGKSNVIFINSLDELNIKPKLEQAERAYSKENNKVVVVSEPEPANSHPVVNFSGLAVTCLLTDDPQHVEKMADKASGEVTLAIDSQTGDGYLLKGDPEAFVSQGYAVHPMNLALSVTEADVGTPPSTRKEAPQDVKDLLITIRSAATHEAALEALQALRQHPDTAKARQRKQELEAKMQEHTFIPRRVEKALTALDAIDRALTGIFEETEATIRKAPPAARLKPLIRVKALTALLAGSPGKKQAVGQYSLLDVDFIYNDALALVDYQKKFDHPVHFSGIYLAGDRAFDSDSTQQWRTFLENLEPQVESGAVTSQQVKQLHEMVKALEKTNMLSTWLAFFFKTGSNADRLPSWISSFTKGNSIEEVLSALPISEIPIVDSTLELASAIHTFKGNIGAFSSPDTFEEAFGRLSQLKDSLSDEQLIDRLKTASPVVQLMIQNTLMEGVDLFDGAIKAMKASNNWTPEQKVPLFRRMLIPYFDLLKNWTTQMKTVLTIPANMYWPLAKYMKQMETSFQMLLVNDVAQLKPSHGFSVDSSVFGAITYFTRHLPKTHEDFFTLTHQNLIGIISNLKNQLISNEVIRDAAIPESLKKVMSMVEEKDKTRVYRVPEFFGKATTKDVAASKPIRTNIKISDESIVVQYNLVMRDHSAGLKLTFDKETGSVAFEADFFGEAKKRWGFFAADLMLQDIIGRLPLKSPIRANLLDFKFEWDITSIDNLNTVLDQFYKLAEATFLWLSITGDFVVKECPNEDVLLNLFDRVLNHPDEVVRVVAPDLIVNLVAQGKGIEVAVAAFPNLLRTGFFQPGYGLINSESLPILVDELLKHGKGVEIAMAAALEAINSQNLQAEQIFNSLINDESVLEKLIAAAELSASNQNSSEERAKGFGIFQMLVKYGKGNDKAVIKATKGANDPDAMVRVQALGVLIKVVEKGEYFEAAKVAAKKGASDPNPQVRLQALLIDQKLVEKMEAFEAAELAAMIGASDTNPQVRLQALAIVQALVEKGEGSEAAKVLAMNGADDTNTQIKLQKLTIIQMLVEKGEISEGAIAAAAKGVHDKDPMVRRRAYAILDLLVISESAPQELYNKILKEACTAAAMGMIDPDHEVRYDSYELFLKVLEREIGDEEAIVAAGKALYHMDAETSTFGIRLFQTLFKRRKGTKEAIALASKGIYDRNPVKRERSLSLLNVLFRSGNGSDEAINLAIMGINDHDPIVRTQAIKIFELAFEVISSGDRIAAYVKGASEPIQREFYSIIETLIAEHSSLSNMEHVLKIEAALPYTWQFILWWQRMMEILKA